MKTHLTSIPQATGHPVKIVSPDQKEEHPAITTSKMENVTVGTAIWGNNVTDTPENWDESWFANYE